MVERHLQTSKNVKCKIWKKELNSLMPPLKSHTHTLTFNKTGAALILSILCNNRISTWQHYANETNAGLCAFVSVCLCVCTVSHRLYNIQTQLVSWIFRVGCFDVHRYDANIHQFHIWCFRTICITFLHNKTTSLFVWAYIIRILSA